MLWRIVTQISKLRLIKAETQKRNSICVVAREIKFRAIVSSTQNKHKADYINTINNIAKFGANNVQFLLVCVTAVM